MPSAIETNAQIAQVRNSVQQALKRSMELPGLDSSRLDRISGYTKRNNELVQRAKEIFDDIGKEERGPLDAVSEQLTNKQAEVNDLNSQIQAQPGIINNPQGQALQKRITEIRQGEIPELQRSREAAQQAFNGQLNLLRKNPSPELEDTLNECRELLDEVALFEQEVQSSANTLVKAKVSANLSSNQKAFSDAADYHEKQASNMFWLLVALAALTGVAIYFLFFSDKAVPALAAPSGKDFSRVLEGVLLVGVGRIATLALLGIAFRYVALLHRANSEQLVVYRDRIAALGVAESITQLFPFEKKFDLLKVLADGYLTFEQNAFRQKLPEPAKRRKETNDEAIKQLKDTVDAMKPAFEVVKSIADRTK